jgi:hypothetical protein
VHGLAQIAYDPVGGQTAVDANCAQTNVTDPYSCTTHSIDPVAL